MLNSGEGGLIATDDESLAAYCILAAGFYEKPYRKHLTRPADDVLVEKLKAEVPDFSLRMSNPGRCRPAVPAPPPGRQVEHTYDAWVPAYDDEHHDNGWIACSTTLPTP
jgi:hypothetical protein